MDEAISAGDVGRFAYCALNWQRARAGKEGQGGRAGMQAAEAVAEQVDAYDIYRARAGLTIQSSFLLGLMAISAAAIAVEVFALEHDSLWWWILLFLSILWLAASLYFFVFHLYYQDRAREAQRLQRAREVDLGRSEKGDVLRARGLPLRGRPDLLTQKGDAWVPVSVKGGNSRGRPFDSHVLQLAAYCYLVQESKGVRPPVGVLAYADGQYEVPYTPELEDRLMRTLMRIQLAQRTGNVHRDHENPARCRGCSRREGCPERLS